MIFDKMETETKTVKIISTDKYQCNYILCEICNTKTDEMFHLFNFKKKPIISVWGHFDCLEKFAFDKGLEIEKS